MPGGISNIDICNWQYIGGYASNPKIAIDFYTTATAATIKGPWNQLTGALPYDVTVFDLFHTFFTSATFFGQLAYDIGIGAAGLEKLILPNAIVTCGANNNASQNLVRVPLQIPAGTRVAFRYAVTSTGNSFPLGIAMHGYSGDEWEDGYNGTEDMGVTISGTNYTTTFVPSTESAASGAWTQVIASTNREYSGLMVGLHSVVQDSTNFPDVVCDIGVGAAGSEEIIIKDCMWDASKSFMRLFSGVQIPAGSRLAVRGNTDTSAYAGTAGCSLYGIYQ